MPLKNINPTQTESWKKLQLHFEQIQDVTMKSLFQKDNTRKEKFTLTFAIPSISGKTVGTSSYLSFRINLPLNTTFTFDVSQVQVEIGSSASDYQIRSLADEVILCQRYFRKSYSCSK